MERDIQFRSVKSQVALPKPNRPWPAVAWFLLALPHFAIPAGVTYHPPAASIVLVLWTVSAILHNKTIRIRLDDVDWLRQPLFLFLGYCVLSAVYGYWLLAESNRLVLNLEPHSVDYLGAVAERLTQLLLIVVAFEVVRMSRYRPDQLMRWWLNGTTIAVGLHLLTYPLLSDPMEQRRGTFTEGNVAGLYYLLSMFVALEYREANPSKRGMFFLLAAVGGVLLSRSTAGIVIMVILGASRFSLGSRHVGPRILRSAIIVLIVPLVTFELYARGIDFGIGEKLFEQEVTANSFSRIDRLASISAAFELFKSAPILGHGLQSYGFLSNDLLSGPILLVYDNSYRRIPNNIYLEIAAEMGIVGLLLFGLLLSKLVIQSWLSGRGNKHSLFFGVLAIFFYWNAFPTYTVVFIWAFFGLIAAVYQRTRQASIEATKAHGKPAKARPPGRSPVNT